MMLIRPILLFLVGLALLLTVRPDDAIETSLIARADSYRTTFAYSMAQPYVRAALARQPWNAALYVRAGLIALGQRQYDEAPAQFDLAEQAGADQA